MKNNLQIPCERKNLVMGNFVQVLLNGRRKKVDGKLILVEPFTREELWRRGYEKKKNKLKSTH